MADDATYEAFLRKANDPPSSSTQTTASSVNEATVSKHPLLPMLNDKLAYLSTNTFVTETDSDFVATFIPSSTLPSWSDSTNKFPSPTDLETQVEAGRDGEILLMQDWDPRGQHMAVAKAIKEVTKQNEIRVYTIQGRGGRFEVFILAKVEGGLLGAKAKGVAT
jgi:hypothetical protein